MRKSAPTKPGDREAAVIAARALELRRQRGRWGGMALLLGSWTSAGIYEEALRAVGAPTYALQQEGFYRRQELVDLLVALEAIRDPRNDIALVGFLRGPFVGVRDETLLNIALTGPGPHWERLPAYQGGEVALVARGLDLLHRIRSAAMLETHSQCPEGFDLDQYILEGGLGYRIGPPITLQAVISTSVALFLMETPLATDQSLHQLPDCSYQLLATVADTRELRSWLRSFGDAVRVEVPADFLEQQH